jgi:uncharacterized protein YggE
MSAPKYRKGDTIILVISLVALLIVGYFFKDDIFPRPGMISVTGEGQVEVEPELARITVSWISAGTNAEAAIKNEKTIFNILTKVLQDNGVKEPDIQVAHARVVAPTDNSGQYQAVNALDAKVYGLENLDQLVAGLYQNGAANVTNIVLSTDNQEELEDQAVALAIEDAKIKAQQTAKAAKKRLGRLVSLTSDATGQVNAVTTKKSSIATEEASGFSRPVETETGVNKIEIVRRVSVVYEIK